MFVNFLSDAEKAELGLEFDDHGRVLQAIAHPSMVNLSDIWVVVSILSPDYQRYACDTICRTRFCPVWFSDRDLE